MKPIRFFQDFQKELRRLNHILGKKTKSTLHLFTKQSKSFKKTKKKHQVRHNTEEIKIHHKMKGVYKPQICIRFLYPHYPYFFKGSKLLSNDNEY